ncbi:polysaccharide deacetylase family sporulation protein PdaB [Clostridium cavendishii DSM 21758]|uniref:Polysaccharide deacetylase family sporulation protein PdaB n=1 Tax=Clostridium cavendishii DSM 21758 TaxID=1121302 RepID=A0A1M6KZF2_9CLOT|nr:polysaccharide deacetylase family protein [Clostridium cavendishii]SHJ64368.1 polysaccharide deacetylase family sporulation protein PdaB [Clostridium cavendishii DSM 21758]
MRRFKNKVIVFLVFIISVLVSIATSNDFGVSFTKAEHKVMPIYGVDISENAVALTFDVNWADKDYLGDILKILDKHKVKATFFVMGKWVIYPDGNVEKLKAIKDGGHEIGNHSYVHPDFQKIDEKRMKEEVKRTEDIILDKVGVKTILFRCPSGSYNDKAINVVNSLGYKCIHWDVDSVDWKEQGKEIEYNRVIKKIKPGSIILFHNNAKYTPENLDRLLEELNERHYKVLKVSEILYNDKYGINSDGRQYLIK